MMNCLCCGKPIEPGKPEEQRNAWHSGCVRRFFGTHELPLIDLNKRELDALAVKTVEHGLTVPGVQKKLSLHLSKENIPRLTLVDYPSGYILKPQAPGYTALPEAEDLVMRMAEAAGIPCVPHALICLPRQKKEYAYITRRIDRIFPSKGSALPEKLAMEDFCQLGFKLTEDKYHGSYENCVRILKRYSSRPGLDIAELYYRILFFYFTGNSDMHLKNFSLIEQESRSRRFILSPAYDLLPVNVIVPEDPEELALTLNGKKRNLRKNDFLKFAENSGIPKKAALNLLDKMLSCTETFISMCENSFLPDEMKEAFCSLIQKRAGFEH